MIISRRRIRSRSSTWTEMGRWTFSLESDISRMRAIPGLGLYWYRWSQQEGQFIKHVIDYGTKAGGGIQIIAVDIDGDGEIDLVAPGNPARRRSRKLTLSW